jgi:hypothetical protein
LPPDRAGWEGVLLGARALARPAETRNHHQQILQHLAQRGTPPALCAVLLRKSVMACATQAQGSLISLLSPAVGQALKSHLLACIQSEPKKHIRKKVCDAVGQLGINLLNADQQNGWPELLPFMLQGTRSGDANMHEASLTIFNALADFMCEKMVPYHATLLEVFRGSLQTDQPMAVRIAGLKGLASFLLALQSADTRNHFQELVPLMLQAIAQALTS